MGKKSKKRRAQRQLDERQNGPRFIMADGEPMQFWLPKGVSVDVVEVAAP